MQVLNSIGRESGSVAIGEHVVRNLRKRCLDLVRLPGTLGRSRPELTQDLRSAVEGTFVIFFRYTGSHFEVVAIVVGRRDVTAVEAHLHSILKQ